jgi:hypothetical protein
VSEIGVIMKLLNCVVSCKRVCCFRVLVEGVIRS